MDEAVIKEMGNKLPKTYRTLIFASRIDCLLDYFAESLDGHLALYSFIPRKGKDLFSIVDGDKAKEADKRLYESALKYISDCDVEDQTRCSKVIEKSR